MVTARALPDSCETPKTPNNDFDIVVVMLRRGPRRRLRTAPVAARPHALPAAVGGGRRRPSHR
eukprot:14692666-Heterocapsa_arctica.AAC.1